MRHKRYGQAEDAPSPNGDRGWLGVNMRIAPDLLEPGMCASAINMRFRYGKPEPRLGLSVVPWMNKITGTTVGHWTTIYGQGQFADPTTLQLYQLIAADGNVYLGAHQVAPALVPLPAGTTIDTPVTFTQAFNTVLMHRGAGKPTLVMDNVQEGFRLPDTTEAGTGTLTLPESDRSLFFQNRVWVPNDNDEIAFSDIGDYTRYSVQQEFRINQGAEDRLVNIAKFNDTTMIAFKDHSVHVLTNLFGDMSQARADVLTSQYGLVAPESIAQVGRDLWFLSELGVMSITQTEDNKLQGVVLPVSEPIDPLIKRINWNHAAAASAAYWDNKYYLAVPLDDSEVYGQEIGNGIPADGSGIVVLTNLQVGAEYLWVQGANESVLINASQVLNKTGYFTAISAAASITMSAPVSTSDGSVRRVYRGVNNAILVYDVFNRQWSGHDISPGNDFQKLFVFRRHKERRLFSYSSAGWFFLHEDGYSDQLPEPYTDVVVSGTPANGNTIRINSGDLVTVNTALPGNIGDDWKGLAAGLYGQPTPDASGFADYWAANTWAAPNTDRVPLTDGIRFIATNGVTPAVVITGDWETVTYHPTQPIQTELVTRAYEVDGRMWGRFGYVHVDVQTWAPSLSVSVVRPGVNEETSLVSAETQDRTRYHRPHNAAAYDISNTNDDFLAPYRQDYSVVLDGPTSSGLDLQDGVPLDKHQERRLSYHLTERDRYVQVKITNTQGRVSVVGVNIEGAAQPEHAGSKT